MKTLVSIALICCLSLSIKGQCSFNNTTFTANEEATYEIYYNWGFIWLNAGEALFSVQNESYMNKPALVLKSAGHTYEKYDWIYKVRDTFESVIDLNTVTPYYFERNTSEDRYYVENNYTFNYDNQSIISNTWNNEKGRKADTLKNTACTLDVLSAIYACRTIDFKNKKLNDTIPLQMIIDGEIFNIYIRNLGPETIINRDKRKFNCNKFSVLLVEGTIFKGGEDMFVWVSNDKNQIPVLIEAKILVGSVKAMIRTVTNYKWPANYQVFDENKPD